MKLLFPIIAGITCTFTVAAEKPNIVIILADDMGFSDIGCYGSEIPTPNLDGLASNGLRFTQFYNTARCSPTRASLMTGLHPHQAGMGQLAYEVSGTNKQDPPGYLGYLNKNCVTIAEVLRTVGYKNYLSGKWHLGMRDSTKFPLQRGFDRFYGILTGATSYLKPAGVRPLSLDNKILPDQTDNNYYATDAFGDFAIKTVEEHKSNDPFFLYLAFIAPHWPLQAKKVDIDKFVGKYKHGWDKNRAERFERMKKNGIIPQDCALSERNQGARAWETLSEQEKNDLDYRMAVYAAQISCLDQNVGRLVATLRKTGKLDNTIIIFLSDNGACAEPYTDLGGGNQDQINDPKQRGNVSIGTGWANSSNTPFRNFKSMLHEGGIITPLIVHWPEGLKTKQGSLNATPCYLPDIMATIVDISGATYPTEYNNNKITPLAGRSFYPIIKNDKLDDKNRVMCWEQYGYKAIREGNMKAVFTPSGQYDNFGNDKWELFDLSKDHSELNDLAASQPETLNKLISKWDTWANASQVFPLPVKKGKK